MSPSHDTLNVALAVHTLDEAAAILRVRKSWLERQAAARKIPFTMLGGTYRFTTGHLAAIIRMHEKTPCTDGEAPSPEVSTRRAKVRQHGVPPTVTPLRPRPRSGPRRAA